MGHHITALIGAPSSLARIVESFGPPAATALPFDLSIVPLDDRRLDRLAGDRALSPYEGFTYLGPPLEEGIGRAAQSGRLLYIETDYFGGRSAQGCAVFEAGRLVWKGTASTGDSVASRDPDATTPISRGLARLGVRPSTRSDEFDAVGLWRFRSLAALGLEYVDDDT